MRIGQICYRVIWDLCELALVPEGQIGAEWGISIFCDAFDLDESQFRKGDTIWLTTYTTPNENRSAFTVHRKNGGGYPWNLEKVRRSMDDCLCDEEIKELFGGLRPATVFLEIRYQRK